MAGDLQHYETRYPEFMATARADVEELLTTGRMLRAIRLSDATGQHLNSTVFPMFFTGDLDADAVLVHLNPHHPEVHAERMAPPYPYDSFEDYFERHRYYGLYHYGARATAKQRPNFDAKQIRFLRPFGVLEFADGDDPATRLLNLERVVDHKLQMELIPYSSPNFETHRFPARVIRDDFDRVLRVVCERPRRFVFFCGKAFEPLIGRYAVDDHRFFLTKSDGGVDSMQSRFANLRIPFEGGEVAAGLCHSWARQGIPMADYGRAVAARYQTA